MPRDGTDMAMSDRAANTTRNLERQQWKTTYDLHHTGIGPANQHKLDNLADKQNARLRTGQEDDAIVSAAHCFAIQSTEIQSELWNQKIQTNANDSQLMNRNNSLSDFYFYIL